jgi:hypothetical protein
MAIMAGIRKPPPVAAPTGRQDRLVIFPGATTNRGFADCV